MRLVVMRDPRPAPPPAGMCPLEPAPTSRHGAVVLTEDDQHWALLNVAPHVAGRLPKPPMPGQRRPRDVVLTDAQVDHVSGLLSLRDGGPINLYATPAVFEVLSQSLPVLHVLQHYCGVNWHVIPVAGETQAASFRVGSLPHLEFTALATHGTAPPYVPAFERNGSTGLSIALAVQDAHTGQRLFCARGSLNLGEAELDWMRSADCVLIDEPSLGPGDGAWPAECWAHSSTEPRAQRRVLFTDASRQGVPADWPEFEAAYDGMVIDL